MRFPRKVHLSVAMLVLGGAPFCVTEAGGMSPEENAIDHGVAAPVGRATWGPSIIATQDGNGKRLVFIKLWTGSKSSYLFIDAETGETEQIMPDPDAESWGGWGAYLTLKGSDGTIYDTIGKHMVAIDVAKRKVRRLGKIPSGMALSFLEGDDGTIYAGIYPKATLVAYDPQKKQYTDFGALNEEDWPQYPRPLCMGSEGWVYCGISISKMQVVGFHPATGRKQAFIPETNRKRGNVSMHRGVDGEVYANAAGWGWHRLKGGEAVKVDKAAAKQETRRDQFFPDGSYYKSVSVPNRTMTIVDKPGGKAREVRFDYESTGVNIYTISNGPGDKVYGATGIPLRIWQFDPDSGEMNDRGLGEYGGHINQFVYMNEKLYGGVYSNAALLEYDPARPYEDVNLYKSGNPKCVFHEKRARDLFGRPHAVFAHPDGRHVLMGGAAQRTLTGGGMLIYDTQSDASVVLTRKDLLADQVVNAMTALPDGDIIVGTSTKAATGGAPTEGGAILYRLDFAARKIARRWPLEPKTAAVRDLLTGSDGLIYGIADPNRFFVFDPEKGGFVYDEPVDGYGNAAGYQAPRCMVFGPDGNIYALFREAIVRIDPTTRRHEAVSRPGTTITAGLAILDGRLYFASGPRLYSCSIAP